MRYARILMGLLLIFLLLELLTLAWSPPQYVFSPPSAALGLVAGSLARFGEAWAYTVMNAAVGFAIGIGVAAGLLAAAYFMGRAGRVVTALVDSLQSFPKESLFPIFVLWLGFGPQTKIVNSALLSFIPVFIAVFPPLLFPRRDYLEFYRSFGRRSRWAELTDLRAPAAVPGLYAGLRLALPLSLVGAVLGEFLGGGEGLGHMIIMGSLAFRVDQSFAAIYLLAITGVVILELLDALFLRGLKRFFEADLTQEVERPL